MSGAVQAHQGLGVRVRISELTTEQVAGRLNDILLLMTLDGRILDVNEAGLKAYGYTLEELRTMDIRDLRTPEEQERAGAQMRTAALEGILFESEHHSKGGVIFPVQVRSARVEVDGQSALFSVIRDITDSKRMQDVLSERNARLAVIVEGAGVGTWEWNVQTGELVINERWARIIGFTLDELAPVSVETWEKYGHPDDLIRSGELLDLHFAGELEYYDFECRMRHKDGHWVWVRDRGRVLTRTADGEPLIMVGTHTDITELKRTEEVLRREQKMFAHAEAVAHIGSWRMSLEDREVVWSDEIYRIFGLDRATYQGDLNSAARDAVHPDDIERFMAASNAVRDGEEILALSAVRIIRPDGEIRWIVGSAEEELDDDGRAVALLGFAQDVTEIVEAQAAIEAREATTASLLNAVTESAVLMGRDGTILAANKAVSERLGGSANANMVGKNVYDFFDPEIAASRRVMVEQVIATGEPVRFEDVRNGRALVNSMSPVFSGDAEPHLAVFGYDITELRASEAAIRRSEEWLRESQRVARLGHFVYDIESDVWEASAAIRDVLGVNDDFMWDFEGWMGCIHPSDQARIRSEAGGRLRDGRPFDFECRIIRQRDGVERWVHAAGHVDREEGRSGTVFGIIQDITERRLAERLLDRERDVSAQVEAIAHIGSWWISLIDGQDEWSAESVRILGFDPALEKGDRLAAMSAIVHPDDREMFGRSEMRSLLDGGKGSMDFRIVRPDGEVRWITAHAAPEIGEDGEPVAVTGFLQDMTDRKHAEDERIAHLEEAANIDRLTGLHNRRGFEFFNATNERPYQISVSTGTAWCEPGDSCDLETLRVTADANMYAEKMRRRES